MGWVIRVVPNARPGTFAVPSAMMREVRVPKTPKLSGVPWQLPVAAIIGAVGAIGFARTIDVPEYGRFVLPAFERPADAAASNSPGQLDAGSVIELVRAEMRVAADSTATAASAFEFTQAHTTGLAAVQSAGADTQVVAVAPPAVHAAVPPHPPVAAPSGPAESPEPEPGVVAAGIPDAAVVPLIPQEADPPVATEPPGEVPTEAAEKPPVEPEVKSSAVDTSENARPGKSGLAPGHNKDETGKPGPAPAHGRKGPTTEPPGLAKR